MFSLHLKMRAGICLSFFQPHPDLQESSISKRKPWHSSKVHNLSYLTFTSTSAFLGTMVCCKCHAPEERANTRVPENNAGNISIKGNTSADSFIWLASVAEHIIKNTKQKRKEKKNAIHPFMVQCFLIASASLHDMLPPPLPSVEAQNIAKLFWYLFSTVLWQFHT